MTERIRINRIELGQTLAGKGIVHLFAPGAQYSKFPVLYLFDPGLLVQVGIDPNKLGEDPIHVSLWAHYELSEKMNAQGNPYKDIISLERIDALATTTSTDNSAVLAELRAIKALLLDLATGPSTRRAERIHAVMQAGRTGSASDPPQSRTDPAPVPEAGTGTGGTGQATEPVEELTEADARNAFYELAGHAIAEGHADPGAVNDLAKSANGQGWNGALAGLKELLIASN